MRTTVPRPPVSGLGALILFALLGCQKISLEMNGLACLEGDCEEGYSCDEMTNICITAGDGCEQQGRRSPCVRGEISCRQGCRECRDEAWSECLVVPTGDECRPGSSSCNNGGNLVICDRNGFIDQEALCPYGCNAATSPARCNDCVPGNSFCDTAGNLVRCGPDGLEALEPCHEAGCNDLIARPRCNACVPDLKSCDASGNLVTCDDEGLIADTQLCGPAGCDDAAPEPRCNGCAPGAIWCEGDTLFVCTAEGTTGSTEFCGLLGCNHQVSPPHCNECKPSDSWCSGLRFITCGADGLLASGSEADCTTASFCSGVGICDPNAGCGVMERAPDGTPCGPDGVCGASCQQGICQQGVLATDGMPCGDGVCDACKEGACEPSEEDKPGPGCADRSDTDCTDPETCDGQGGCKRNHANDGIACGDGVCSQCAFGVCVNSPAGTSGHGCQDRYDTVCTDADTCDGYGECQSNDASDGTPCDDGVCNECLDGACVFSIAGEPGPGCSSSEVTACTEGDLCADNGECDFNHADDQTPCGVCQQCVDGACQFTPADQEGPECDDDTTSPCNLPDACDGRGGCDRRLAEDLMPCGVCQQCVDGACQPTPADQEGPECDDDTTGPCNLPDTCDGRGGCLPNHQPALTPCGVCRRCTDGACQPTPAGEDGPECDDDTESECDGQDVCAENGVCDRRQAQAGTACGDVCHECLGGACEPTPDGRQSPGCDTMATSCAGGESCDGAGNCQIKPVASGMPCPESGACDSSCDGVGACMAGDPADVNAPCGNQGVCVVGDECDGAGHCLDRGFLARGSPCATGSDSVCGGSCDGDGNCETVYQPVGTPCPGVNGLLCDSSCSDQGTCDDQALPSDGAACFQCNSGACSTCRDGDCHEAGSCGEVSCREHADCTPEATGDLCQELPNACVTTGCWGHEQFACADDPSGSPGWGAGNACSTVACTNDGVNEDESVGSDCARKRGTVTIAYSFQTFSPSGTMFNLWMRNIVDADWAPGEAYVCYVTGVSGTQDPYQFGFTEDDLVAGRHWGTSMSCRLEGTPHVCWMAVDGDNQADNGYQALPLTQGHHTLTCTITTRPQSEDPRRWGGYDGIIVTTNLGLQPVADRDGCQDSDVIFTAGACTGNNWGPNIAPPPRSAGTCTTVQSLPEGLSCKLASGGDGTCCHGTCIDPGSECVW